MFDENKIQIINKINMGLQNHFTKSFKKRLIIELKMYLCVWKQNSTENEIFLK